MLLSKLAASAATVALVFSTSSYAAELTGSDCWRADEAKAARIQNLQTMFMIDAIKCQDTIPATLESYNLFMVKRHDMLVANKYIVQAHFVRIMGPDVGVKASTDYDTQLGNKISSSAIDVQRCKVTGMYARLAGDATEDDLVAMSDLLVGNAPPAVCPATVAAPPSPTAMVIPVWKKQAPPSSVPVSGPTPAVATAQVAAAPMAMSEEAAVPAVDTQATAVPPAIATTAPLSAAPAVAPATAVSAPTTAPVSQADAIRALQQAAAALSQAAASLQPDTTQPGWTER